MLVSPVELCSFVDDVFFLTEKKSHFSITWLNCFPSLLVMFIGASTDSVSSPNQ